MYTELPSCIVLALGLSDSDVFSAEDRNSKDHPETTGCLLPPQSVIKSMFGKLFKVNGLSEVRL